MRGSSTPAAAIPADRGADGGEARRGQPRGAATSSIRCGDRSGRRSASTPSTIDPTLRTDLLAKVAAVEPSGGSRNLFAFGQQPPPKVAELEGAGAEAPDGAAEAPKPAAAARSRLADAPPPPITLKFYGFSTMRNNGKKSAYFLDGDDILIAAEGETLKKRYKLVRISAGSVLLEDTESKRQQSVPLTQEAPSS